MHRTKLFRGRATAEEVHAKFGIRLPCHTCNGMPVILIKTMMLHDEFVKRCPAIAAEVARTNPRGPFVPTFPTTYGPMVMVSQVAACKTHQAAAEKAAAKLPSYILVEINRGPGADKAQVSVGHLNMEGGQP